MSTGSIPETTLPEQIENVAVMARAVQDETPRGPAARCLALSVTKLEEARFWAEEAERADEALT